MNFLSFVLSLLLIFSFSSLIVLEKQAGNRRLRSTYLGHIVANRKILSKCETETYQSLRSLPKQTGNGREDRLEKPDPPHKKPELNPPCARFNIWPLIQEGKEAHPLLYETVLKLLKNYYGSSFFCEANQTEVHFLNIFLKRAKEETKNNSLPLEKIHLHCDLQPIYYRMLKGSKNWDYEQNVGYPSFLDVIKAEEDSSKICLNHAHPAQIAVLFGSKAANSLYDEIHRETSEKLSRELIEKKCSEAHTPIFNPEIFELIEIKNSSHERPKKTTFIAEDRDSKVSVRKNIYTRSD